MVLTIHEFHSKYFADVPAMHKPGSKKGALDHEHKSRKHIEVWTYTPLLKRYYSHYVKNGEVLTYSIIEEHKMNKNGKKK